MEQPIFAGSRIKVERAVQFIGELESAFDAYNKSNFASAEIVVSEGPPAVKVAWTSMGLLPGAILGDAVHNLRTALDLMASELARINGKSDSNVYFPFASSPENLDAVIRKRNFHKAGEDAVELLRRYAPYKSGNTLLRAIHDLDRRDKHTSLLETERHMSLRVCAVYEMWALEKGTVKIDYDNSTVVHNFWQDMPLAGLPVINTLKQLVQLVYSIIEAFTCLVLAREPKQ